MPINEKIERFWPAKASASKAPITATGRENNTINGYKYELYNETITK